MRFFWSISGENVSKHLIILVWQYVAHFEVKKKFLKYLSHFLGLKKQFRFPPVITVPLDFPHFKLIEKKLLSEKFLASFRDSQFYNLKRRFMSISRKNA